MARDFYRILGRLNASISTFDQKIVIGNQFYAMWIVTGALLIGGIARRMASDARDQAYGLPSMLTDMGFHFDEPDYNKFVAEVYEDFSFGVIERIRSLYTLWAFPNLISAPTLPSWVLDLQKNSDRLKSRDLHLESHGEMHFKFFREGFKLERRRGQLVLEGLIIGSLKILGSKVPDLHTESFDGGSAKMAIINWLSKHLEMADQVGHCPNGGRGSKAFLDALRRIADIALAPHLTEERVKSLIESIIGYHTISRDPECRKRFTSAVKNPDLDQLSPQAMFDHLCLVYDSQTQELLSNLYRIYTNSKEKTPVVLSNGCVGLGRGNMQVAHTVALLYGRIFPMVIRSTGDRYQLVGPALICGIPDQLWPLRRDEKGIQTINLV